MSNAPDIVDEKQLEELCIKVDEKEVEEKETPIFIWVIPVVLLAVCIGSYFAFRKKRIDSNEDHL